MSLVDAIPQTIKEIGRLRAGGLAGKGAYGASVAGIGQAIGEIPGRMSLLRRSQQQEQSTALDIAAKQREAAADQALQNAMSGALSADGSIDTQKLGQLLAGTPAASAYPKIVESFAAMQRTAADLQTSRINAQDAEDDALGAIANAAEQVTDPHDRAGLISTGLASGIKNGTVKAERGKELTAGMLGDDGQPDPAKVETTLKTLKAKSKEQRTLAATDALRAGQAEDTASRIEDRTARAAVAKETAEQKTFNAQLENFSRQLSAATTPEKYARVYQGLPETLRPYFDAPAEFNAQRSPQRAREAMMTPAEMETARRDRVTESGAAADRSERERHNRADEARTRVGSDVEPDDIGSARTKRLYDAFVGTYEKAYPRIAAGVDENGDRYPAKNPPAPPSLEKWSVMTPQERQAVLGNPSARIDDAEMQRRSQQGAPAAAGDKTVTEAVLAKQAARLGHTIEQERERAKAAGYTVVP